MRNMTLCDNTCCTHRKFQHPSTSTANRVRNENALYTRFNYNACETCVNKLLFTTNVMPAYTY